MTQPKIMDGQRAKGSVSLMKVVLSERARSRVAKEAGRRAGDGVRGHHGGMSRERKRSKLNGHYFGKRLHTQFNISFLKGRGDEHEPQGDHTAHKANQHGYVRSDYLTNKHSFVYLFPLFLIFSFLLRLLCAVVKTGQIHVSNSSIIIFYVLLDSCMQPCP